MTRIRMLMGVPISTALTRADAARQGAANSHGNFSQPAGGSTRAALLSPHSHCLTSVIRRASAISRPGMPWSYL
jgi:hypothetical protein